MAAASSTISQDAVSFDDSSASGAIKFKRLAGKARQHIDGAAGRAVTMASRPRAGAATCPRGRICHALVQSGPSPRYRVDATIRARSPPVRPAGDLGGMPVRARDGQREPRRVRLPPEQHIGVGDKLPTAEKQSGGDWVGRIASSAGSPPIHPGRPVGEGRQQHQPAPARRVPLRAARAATSYPRRASKKACMTSRPSSVFRAPGATPGAKTGSGPTHRPSPASLSRSACACCSVQLVAAEHQQMASLLPRHLRGEVKQRVHHRWRLQGAAEGVALRRVAAVETAFEPGVALF